MESSDHPIPREPSNNNLVAESDLTAALEALQERFRTSIFSSTTTNKEQPNSEQQEQQPHNANNTNNTESVVFQTLLTDCSNSLTRKIRQSVQPVSDEAFHAYLARYRDDLISDDPSNENHQQTSTESLKDEFDEDALIDREAVARVVELRRAVREQVAVVQSLRTQATEQALAEVERQLQHQQQQLLDISCNNNKREDDGVSVAAAAESVLKDHQSAVAELALALQSLTEALVESESVLPAKLGAIETSLRSIQSSLETNNCMQNPSGDVGSNSLSQIEKAIYSREAMSHHLNNDNYDDDANATTTMDLQALLPEQRLADLLCRGA